MHVNTVSGCLTGLTEVRVIHGLAGCQAGLVVIAQQLVEEIQSLWTDEVLVLTVDKPLPPLTRMPERENTNKTTMNTNTVVIMIFTKQ